MLDLDEKSRICAMHSQKIKEIGESLKISELEKELTDLEKKTLNPEFWSNPEESNKVSARIAEIKKICQKYNNIEKDIENNSEFLEMLKR